MAVAWAAISIGQAMQTVDRSSANAASLSTKAYLVSLALEVVSDTMKLVSLVNVFFFVLFGVFVLLANLVDGVQQSDTASLNTLLVNYGFLKALMVFFVLVPTYEVEIILWLMWFGFQAMIKGLSLIAKRRLERVSSIPNTPPSVHRNNLTLLGILLVLNIAISGGVFLLVAPISIGILLLLMADAATSVLHTAHTLLRYAIFMKDQAHAGNWEWRADACAYVDFGCDVSTLLINLAHLLHVWLANGLDLGLTSFILLLNVRSTLTALASRWGALRSYMALNRTLEATFPNATDAELLAGPEDRSPAIGHMASLGSEGFAPAASSASSSSATSSASSSASSKPSESSSSSAVASAAHRKECSICLEPMNPGRSSKKLPHCGHCFHRVCLRRWLFDGHDTCPLCRQGLTPEARAAAAAAEASRRAGTGTGTAAGGAGARPAAPPADAGAARPVLGGVAGAGGGAARPPLFLFGGDVGLEQQLLQFEAGGGWFPRMTLQFGGGARRGAAGAARFNMGDFALGRFDHPDAIAAAVAAGAPPANPGLPATAAAAAAAGPALPPHLDSAYRNLLEMFPHLSPAGLRTHLLLVARGDVAATADAALAGDIPPLTPEEARARQEEADQRREAEDEATRQRAVAAVASLSPSLGPQAGSVSSSAAAAGASPVGSPLVGGAGSGGALLSTRSSRFGTPAAASSSLSAATSAAIHTMSPMALASPSLVSGGASASWLAAYQSDPDEDDDDPADADCATAAATGVHDDTAAALRALARRAGVSVADLPPPDRFELCDARKAAMIRRGRKEFKRKIRQMAEKKAAADGGASVSSGLLSASPLPPFSLSQAASSTVSVVAPLQLAQPAPSASSLPPIASTGDLIIPAAAVSPGAAATASTSAADATSEPSNSGLAAPAAPASADEPPVPSPSAADSAAEARAKRLAAIERRLQAGRGVEH